MGYLYLKEIQVKTFYKQNPYLLAQPMFKQSITEPMVVTPIPMSDSTHFRAITGNGKVENVKEKPTLLGADEAIAPASMEVEDIGAAARIIADLEDEQRSAGYHVHNKTDSPSKRKGWFS